VDIITPPLTDGQPELARASTGAAGIEPVTTVRRAFLAISTLAVGAIVRSAA